MTDRKSDTSRAAEEAQLRAIRAMTGAQRFQIAVEMSELARDLSKARIRSEHPEWSEREVIRELVRIAFAPAEPPADFR